MVAIEHSKVGGAVGCADQASVLVRLNAYIHAYMNFTSVFPARQDLLDDLCSVINLIL